MIRKFVLTSVAIMACCFAVNAAFSPKEIRPADGEEVASLSKVTVIWPGDWLGDVTFEECGRVEDEQGTQVATITCEENWGYDNAACDFILSEKISTPGTYILYINADAVQGEDEEWNDAFQLTYKVVSASDAKISLVSANPENNTVVPTLSKIETFWSESDFSINREVMCAVSDSEGEVVSEIEVSKGYFSSAPVTFTLAKPVETAGTYKVTIPAGVLETEDGVKSEAVELTYIVDPSAVTILHPITVDPEDGEIVGMLYKINITWDGEFDFDYEAEEVGKVTDELGITVATLSCSADILEENVLIFTLSDPVSEDGEYTVEIDKDAIKSVDGAKNESILLTYTVDSSQVEENLSYHISPSDSKITGETFPDVEIWFDEDIIMLIDEFSFVSSAGTEVTAKGSLYWDTVTLDCSEIKTAGKWTLKLPKGAFKSLETGNINAAREVEWTFGVESGLKDISTGIPVSVSGNRIIVDSVGNAAVYDLNGHKLIEKAGGFEFEASQGVYFIKVYNEAETNTYKIYVSSK